MLILKYEKGRVPKKKGRGEHPAKSASRGRSLNYDSQLLWRGKISGDSVSRCVFTVLTVSQ